MSEKISRRELLRRTAVTGAVAAGGFAFLNKAVEAVGGGKSRVIVVRDQTMLTGGSINQKVTERMLGQAIAKLMGTDSAAKAWKSLFKPSDVVGIKVNCLFGKGVSTHLEVAYAVVAGLKMAGVKPENIIIWDRSIGDLVKCGYMPNKGRGVQVIADDDWGEIVKSGSFNGRLSKILTDKITAMVNVPILKTHGLARVSCALKNHYGTFDNPGAHHGDGCNPYLADLNALPQIKGKTRLVVVDAARPQCDGGPGLQADAQFDYYGLIVSRDPLAVDRVGLDIINEGRKRAGKPEYSPESVKWLASAAIAGVGMSDPAKIDLVRV